LFGVFGFPCSLPVYFPQLPPQFSPAFGLPLSLTIFFSIFPYIFSGSAAVATRRMCFAFCSNLLSMFLRQRGAKGLMAYKSFASTKVYRSLFVCLFFEGLCSLFVSGFQTSPVKVIMFYRKWVLKTSAVLRVLRY